MGDELLNQIKLTTLFYIFNCWTAYAIPVTGQVIEVVRITAEALSEPGLSFEAKREVFQPLDQLIKTSELGSVETEEVISASISEGYFETIFNHHYIFEIETEKREARDSLKFGKVIHDMTKAKRFIKSEVCMIPTHFTENLLFVGAGATPYTAVEASRILPSDITLCDLDAQNLELAEKYTEGLNLAKTFHFLEVDATSADLSKFDVIWLAAMVLGKSAILQNRSINSGTYVLIRQNRGLGQLFYGKYSDFTDQSEFMVIDKTKDSEWSCFESFLLRKKEK